MTAVVLLLLHVVSMGILVVLWKKRRLRVDLAALIAFAFLPGFGELALLMLHFLAASGWSGRKAGDLEVMRGDAVRQSVYHEREDDSDRSAVPLEDALILGDSTARRSAMMDMLMEDSGGSMPAIRRAKKSEDTEVVHYATTAMTDISRKYDLRLQRASVRYQNHPESDEALDRYIYILGQYLEDGIAEGELLKIQREQYQNLLAERIRRKKMKEDYADLAASLMDSGDMRDADRVIGEMEGKWLRWERTLDLRLRYYYETGQGGEIQKLLDRVNHDTWVPESVGEIIRFWEGKNTDAQK